MDACKIAGLECIRMISEPTAASIAYRLTADDQEQFEDSMNILVFDYGGGTLDVSVITVADFSMGVESTAGDGFLGGRDFDVAVAEFCAQALKRDLDIELTTFKSKEALRDACENAKFKLDTSETA